MWWGAGVKYELFKCWDIGAKLTYLTLYLAPKCNIWLAPLSGLLGERGVCMHSLEEMMHTMHALSWLWNMKQNPHRRNLTSDQTLPRASHPAQHTTNTAATVSWWTTCVSLSFCGFMAENYKEVMHEAKMIVDKQTKQTVFVPLWGWLDTSSGYEPSVRLQAASHRKSNEKLG